MTFIPLLSPKPFADFTPEEYKAYVVSLYQAPPAPPPKADYTASVNKKGTLTLRINRVPKFLTFSEALDIAKGFVLPYQDVVMLLKKKKIELRQNELPVRNRKRP